MELVVKVLRPRAHDVDYVHFRVVDNVVCVESGGRVLRFKEINNLLVAGKLVYRLDRLLLFGACDDLLLQLWVTRLVGAHYL